MAFQNIESPVNLRFMTSESRSLELRFSNKSVSSPVYTGKPIKGEGEIETIEIVLFDTRTGEDVKDGRVASARVELVLLGEEFPTAGGDNDDWTALEFETKIVREWKNKKNLLQGTVSLVLRHGRGTVGEIRIKHDRIYLGTVKFRLGAKVVDCFDEVRIKEAVTDPFEVKDRRNELTNKNIRPLSPTDEVWHLKNIGKSGSRRKRLEMENIKTVEDFIRRHSSDPCSLREIYGKRDKKWDSTVRHAEECIIEKMATNALGSVEFTSQQTNDAYYVDPPEPNGSYCQYQHGSTSSWEFDHDLIFDQNFSIQDFGYLELPAVTCLECQYENQNQELKSDQINQESQSQLQEAGEGGRSAQKRWTKFRRVWFTARSFATKKIGGATAPIHFR